MSGVLCAQTGGYPNFTGSATVTVGYLALTGIDFYGWLGPGFPPSAISPSTWADSGLTVSDLDYRYYSSTGVANIVFTVGGYAPNIGWTTLTIAGVNYTRSAASYGYNGTNTTWVWDASSTGNPFGTTVGATKAVSWS